MVKPKIELQGRGCEAVQILLAFWGKHVRLLFCPLPMITWRGSLDEDDPEVSRGRDRRAGRVHLGHGGPGGERGACAVVLFRHPPILE